MTKEPELSIIRNLPGYWKERAATAIDRINLNPAGIWPHFEDPIELVHEDETGRLFKVSFNSYMRDTAGTHLNGPWRAFVAVLNGTPEKDGGGRKTYFIAVPVAMKTAKEAVAWTYGMTEAEYTDIVRT